MEHVEPTEHQDDDDQELLFVEENGDSDHMVSSIHTSDGTESENSLNLRDDSNRMIESPPDIRTPSSPSQHSEDNSSIESMPAGEFSGRNERDLPVVPAPGETRAQILAPLDDNDDDYDDDFDDKGRIQLTPILTKAVETDDDPPSPTLPEFSDVRRDVNTNNHNSNSNSNGNHLHHPHLPGILFGQQTGLDFHHRQGSSLGGMALSIFHHQMLVPFFQGFSWGIGIHLYRYMRHGFSLRGFWRSLSGGVRGASLNNVE